eukprot:GFYU01001081.1.p1 GENE.GFYU01001081.1~~GFYU01001081.1.p1  ORF type:complete len:407 (+),score=56.07 GFYU01001081.1:197-1417(+)
MSSLRAFISRVGHAFTHSDDLPLHTDDVPRDDPKGTQKWIKGVKKDRKRLAVGVFSLLLCGYFLWWSIDFAADYHKRRTKAEFLAAEGDKAMLYMAEFFNKHSEVRNLDKFPTLAPDHIPIVIYVYNRAHYLAKVLEKLSNVTGIEETILIISHDGIFEDMMQVVREKATFCQTKQIVHPIPIRRPSTLTALKDHWWWLQHQVWYELFPQRETEVVFIEEDHAVSPDFYSTLKSILKRKRERQDSGDSLASQAWGVAMSPYYRENMKEESVYEFDYHWAFMNTGYSYNRTMWTILKENEDLFMGFNDGWDYSFFYLQQIGRFPDVQILPRQSRVYNIGSEGLNCDESQYKEMGLLTMPVSRETWIDPALIVLNEDRIHGVRPNTQPVRDGMYAAPVVDYKEYKDSP